VVQHRLNYVGVGNAQLVHVRAKAAAQIVRRPMLQRFAETVGLKPAGD
jgi:hypothetical protein